MATNDHSAALAVIRALRELGAVHVCVDGIEARFEPVYAVNAGGADTSHIEELKAELKRVRRLALGAFDHDQDLA